MPRPSTITAASWIWLLSSLLTALTIAEVLAEAPVLARVADLGFYADGVASASRLGGAEAIIVPALAAAMILQVVAGLLLRDGARSARTLLSFAAGIALVTAVSDITLLSAWVLLAANMVALGLASSVSASRYLEARSPDPAWELVNG